MATLTMKALIVEMINSGFDWDDEIVVQVETGPLSGSILELGGVAEGTSSGSVGNPAIYGSII
jgi:hypothetical protein